MELQPLESTSANLSPRMSSDHCGQLKNTRFPSDSSDLGHRAALPSNIGQPTGRGLVDLEIAHFLPNDGSSVLQLRIDYARASDEQLIAAAKALDGRAFEVLTDRYTKSICKVVYRIVRNREDTEDVVQDSLLKAYCRLSDFREACGFSTWITKIAINTARMLLRKKKRRSELSLVQSSGTDQTEQVCDVPDPAPSTEQRYSRQETLEYMLRAVNRLPARNRSVLEQYHAQEKSMQETADTLGISVASAKSRLWRARRILRSRLERQQLSIFDACW
jgi:RNA polymerase sigma-70 factor, ECF subfamily